jgi:exopolysaccharide biosynthesis protein
MLKLRFPHRLVLEVSFKSGFPEDFSADNLPIFEKFEIAPNHILDDVNASMDEEGIRITTTTSYALQFDEFYDKESNRLRITIPLVFRYETKTEIKPGIEYIDAFLANPTGPRKLHLVYVDIASNHFRPTILTANDFGHKFLSVDSMAQRCGAICAVNGGFYSPDGNHQGLLIRGGILESYPNFDRPVFATTYDGKIHIGRLPFRGVMKNSSGKSLWFDALDRKPTGDEVVLLTPGHPKRISETLSGSKIVINNYIVEQITTDNVENKKGRYILWSPYFRDDFKDFQVGERIELEFVLGMTGIEVESALGAGPMLISGGEIKIDSDGDFRSDIIRGRAPRTGVGLDVNGRLILAVLEGRNPLGSIGANLYEFADIMKQYGAVVAMNLDGGSSSTLVINGLRKNFVQGASKGVTNSLAIMETYSIEGN